MLTMNSYKANLETYCRAVFEPADVVELRLLPSGKQSWHAAGELPEQFGKLYRTNTDGQNIYAGANPRKAEGHGDANGVALARCLFADFDGISADEANQRIEAAGLPTPTITVASGHGVHCYWKLVEPLADLSDWTRLQKALINTLGSDASIHDPPRIMRLPGFLNVKREPFQKCEVLTTNGNLYSLAELRQLLPAIEPEQPKAIAPAISHNGNGLGKLARATAYVAKTPAVGQGERNRNAFRLSAVLANDFQLPEADSWRLLESWNSGNAPPLDEAELKQVFHSAKEHSKGEPGSKAINGYAEPSYPILHGTKKQAVEQNKQPFEFVRLSSAELDSGTFELSYHVDEILADRQPGVMAGPMKSLKTSLAVALGWSIASGDPFLDSFQVTTPVRSMIMSAESGMAVLQELTRRIAESYGKRLSDATGLLWCDRVPRMGNVVHLEALERLLTGDEIGFAEFDPTYMSLPGGDAGNLMIQGEFLSEFASMLQGIGCTALLVHHTRKNSMQPGEPAELADIAWSGVGEFARQWLLLSRREKYEAGTGLHKLWLNVGGSAGHNGLWGLDIDEGCRPNRHWRVTVLNPDEVRGQAEGKKEESKSKKQQAAIDAAKLKIVYAARKFKDGETERTIRDAAGLGGSLAKAAYAELISSGDLLPVLITKGNFKKPFQGYKVKDDTPQ